MKLQYKVKGYLIDVMDSFSDAYRMAQKMAIHGGTKVAIVKGNKVLIRYNKYGLPY